MLLCFSLKIVSQKISKMLHLTGRVAVVIDFLAKMQSASLFLDDRTRSLSVVSFRSFDGI